MMNKDFLHKLLAAKSPSGFEDEAVDVFCEECNNSSLKFEFRDKVDNAVYSVGKEGGIPVFIDTERDSWNMDPVTLEKAFEIYPEIKVIVVAHLYGTPGKIDEIKAIADKHGALIVEDAAESFGATYKGVQTGSFGDYNCISFNGNNLLAA